eukprot:1383087-Rhodomonas_salina.1
MPTIAEINRVEKEGEGEGEQTPQSQPLCCRGDATPCPPCPALSNLSPYARALLSSCRGDSGKKEHEGGKDSEGNEGGERTEMDKKKDGGDEQRAVDSGG